MQSLQLSSQFALKVCTLVIWLQWMGLSSVPSSLFPPVLSTILIPRDVLAGHDHQRIPEAEPHQEEKAEEEAAAAARDQYCSRRKRNLSSQCTQ
jgi:hypothetical protein